MILGSHDLICLEYSDLDSLKDYLDSNLNVT